MPAVITHHIFGEDASSLLPESVVSGQEELLAFLLGNQGPDPFWLRFTTLPHTANICHEFASRAHSERMAQMLMALRNCVSHLHEEDKPIGRAFTLGMACHYVLDSVAHPLIYAQQEQIVLADPDLACARGEIHGIIEADLDSWMLWQKRNTTPANTPCTQALACTPRIDRVAGAMLSQVAWEVFDLDLGATEYGLAIRDYQLFYRIVDQPNKRLTRTLVRAEHAIRPYSYLSALNHREITDDECPFANLDHRLWRNPATGDTSISSFPDLFHDALMAWPVFSKRLVEGDQTRLEAMIANIDYNGRPV